MNSTKEVVVQRVIDDSGQKIEGFEHILQTIFE